MTLPTKKYFNAYDGAEYYVVATSMKELFTLLQAHEFNADFEYSDGNVYIEELNEEQASKILVFVDEANSIRTPLTAAPAGSLYCTEF